MRCMLITLRSSCLSVLLRCRFSPPLPCAWHREQHRNAGSPSSQPRFRETWTRSTLSVLLFSFTKALPCSFRKAFQTQWRAGCWLDELLPVTGCMPITLIKRFGGVTGWWVCVRLLDGECQMLCSGARRTSCHKTGDGPCWWALHRKHPSSWSLLSTKALLGRISDVSSTVLTFSALTQKQNSFPWSMLNAECTHPSLLSFFLLFLFSY